MLAVTMESTIVSDQYDGNMRVLTLRACEGCGGPHYAPKHVTKRFCSCRCAAQAKSTKTKVPCAWCGNEFLIRPKRLRAAKSGLVFCKRRCKDTAQRLDGLSEIQPSHYGKGGSAQGYRKQAFRLYGAHCRRCGYDRFRRMLDVDHIDGDRSNNDQRNWQVLCVWCHALKTRAVPEHDHVAKTPG